MMVRRVISIFLKIGGYLLPLIQSLPPLGLWTVLMTLPFASYLILIFSNLHVNLPKVISEFSIWFFMPLQIPEKALVIIGLSIFVYSTAFFVINKKEGLITSGPYRLVRHPQYLGMILSTLGLTSWSIWILNNTFGVGFLSPLQTMGVWFLEFFAYIFLAFIEESFLAKDYGESFKEYKRQVPLFIPLLKTNRKELNILSHILIPSILLFILINI
jgi:protein-S-isoprenylcysteine O-methyltransferase Ste14